MEASMKPKPALKKSRKEMRKKENKEDEEKKYKELKHVCRKGGGKHKRHTETPFSKREINQICISER